MHVPISVIIPCYRCSDTVERAVVSVADQTWRPAEVILVDDASGDGTLAALQALQARYGDWINILSLPANGGPGAARNAGWDAARQPYLAFLDADDSWHPRKIEIQFQDMERHPQVAITGHGYSWSQIEPQGWPSLPARYTASTVACWRLLLSNCLTTSTVMLRTNLGYRFEPSRRYSEDYLLWLQIICSGVTGHYIGLKLARRYKAPYGSSGLSGRLWAMERGELANYRQLCRDRLLSRPTALVLSALSLAKYARRVVISMWRSKRGF